MGEREPLLGKLSSSSSSDARIPSTSTLIATSYSASEDRPGGRRMRIPISRAHAINSCPEDDLTDSMRHNLASQRDIDFGFRLRLNLIRRVDSRNAVPPNHVVPSHYFIFVPFDVAAGEQSSLVTVLAIWNTMLGTSILCMPWALQQAGFFLGIGILCFMALCCWYTSALIVKNSNIREVSDFSSVCEEKLGKWGRIVSLVFSLIAFGGAMIVYYVLLCNFLYHVVDYIHHIATPTFNFNHTKTPSHSPYPDAACPAYPLNYSLYSSASAYPTLFEPMNNVSHPVTTIYGILWSQYRSVPLWLLVVILPLVSLKSPTFFTKFNALGAISILFLIGVIIFKASVWGIHFDLKATNPRDVIPYAKPMFVVVCGISSLAFFIHNATIAIMKNQKNQENNIRDLSLGYLLGLLTYLTVGIVFYIGYPLPKECLEDNLLNNIASNDLLSTVSRGFLLFQMLTVFPLLAYIFRSQFMYGLFRNEYPGYIIVNFHNIIVLGVCIVFAMFLPKISVVLRFVGAFCGMVYIFTLPALVHLKTQHQQARLSTISIVFHVILILIGIGIFIGQLATI